MLNKLVLYRTHVLSTIEGQQFVGYISAEEATTLNEEDNPIIVIGKVK